MQTTYRPHKVSQLVKSVFPTLLSQNTESSPIPVTKEDEIISGEWESNGTGAWGYRKPIKSLCDHRVSSGRVFCILCTYNNSNEPNKGKNRETSNNWAFIDSHYNNSTTKTMNNSNNNDQDGWSNRKEEEAVQLCTCSTTPVFHLDRVSLSNAQRISQVHLESCNV